MHATKRSGCADRQVDTFRKDCEHNAKGHDTLDCLTGEQCQQVIHREKSWVCAILIMMTNTINTSQIEFWDKNFFVLNVFCIPCTFFLIVHPQQADMVSRWLHI